jgi:putative peptide zinc metalloprotease protein
VLAAVLAGVLCVPLPYYVAAKFVVEPRDALSVYVEVPGELQSAHVQSGAVAAGQVIAVLDDLDARLAAQKLSSQRSQTIARIESIRQRALADEAALLELAQAEEALAALDVQMARLQQDIAKLTVRAPADGILIPPPARPHDHNEAALATWSGRPLEVKNVGAFLPASTLLGRVAQPGSLEAVLAVPQEELDFLAMGQHVVLLPGSLPGQRIAGHIEHISAEDFQPEPESAKSPKPQRKIGAVIYQASVPVDDAAGLLVVGTTGTARVQAGRQSISARLWRAACRTFHFQL